MSSKNAHTKHEKKLKREVEKKDEQLQKQKEETKQLRSKLRREANQFRKQFAERSLKLVTSGFGLVAALAWNELIKEVIKVYIRPFFGKSSGLVSLLIYAVIVTFLAVLITYQLSKLVEKEN